MSQEQQKQGRMKRLEAALREVVGLLVQRADGWGWDELSRLEALYNKLNAKRGGDDAQPTPGK